MTDITDQDKRDARQWADRILEYNSPGSGIGNAARVVLATVDAPEPTLAEELRGWESIFRNEGRSVDANSMRTLAARAEQIEQERDQARAEVGRLNADLDAMIKMVDSLNDDMSELRGPQPTPVHPSDQQANTQGTLSGSLPDPADVPAGEAWLVEVNGGTVPAIKAGRRRWVYPGAGGYWNSPVVGDWFTLVSRLVPAPRQITTREILDEAPRRTVIRDKDGVVCERASLGDGWYSPESTTDQTDYIKYPATVLWTPEVPA